MFRGLDSLLPKKSQVKFLPDEPTVDKLNQFTHDCLIVNPTRRNGQLEYECYIVLPDGRTFCDMLDKFMSVDKYPFIKGTYYYSFSNLQAYANWSKADFSAVEEAVANRSELLQGRKQIRIIDSQYIDYWKLELQLGISGGSHPIQIRSNDEWVKVRDASSVVQVIAKLEEAYLQNQVIDKNILIELLDLRRIKQASQQTEDKEFWVSLRHRLQHLLKHPEDAKVFAVRPCERYGMVVSGFEYVNPVAVVRLVRPSDSWQSHSDVVNYIKSTVPSPKHPKLFSAAHMADSAFGRKRRESHNDVWEGFASKYRP